MKEYPAGIALLVVIAVWVKISIIVALHQQEVKRNNEARYRDAWEEYDLDRKRNK